LAEITEKNTTAKNIKHVSRNVGMDADYSSSVFKSKFNNKRYMYMYSMPLIIVSTYVYLCYFRSMPIFLAPPVSGGSAVQAMDFA